MFNSKIRITNTINTKTSNPISQPVIEARFEKFGVVVEPNALFFASGLFNSLTTVTGIPINISPAKNRISIAKSIPDQPSSSKTIT